MAQNIVWQRPDGGLSITTPSVNNLDMALWSMELAARKEHEGWIAVAINAEIPTRCEFRNSLVLKDGRVQHDMDKSRELRKNQLRQERIPKMAALDIEYQRADERGDQKGKMSIAQRKQALRDITSDPGLGSAKTLDDLRAVKCPE